jgi:hypothetical protein
MDPLVAGPTADSRRARSGRADWGHGPWDDEPDREEWRDGHTGLPCLARRNFCGVWCGYVAVSPGHPWHGREYDEIDASVHGGLTFAAPCDPDESEPDRICHVPLPGEPDDVWWLGFDCGHVTIDLVPAFRNFSGLDGGTYRTLSYVRNVCADLAEQIGLTR